MKHLAYSSICNCFIWKDNYCILARFGGKFLGKLTSRAMLQMTYTLKEKQMNKSTTEKKATYQNQKKAKQTFFLWLRK